MRVMSQIINAEIILIPNLSISVGELLTINEFFKLSKVNKIFFKKLSRHEILKFIGIRMEPFALRFEDTFSDLLDLESRLNPEILLQVWERLFEKEIGSVKIKFSLDSDMVWEYENVFSAFQKVVTSSIRYSFTYEGSTFIICDIKHKNNDLLFHYVRLKPKHVMKPFPSSKMEDCLIWVIDLTTGFYKHNLWGQKLVEFHMERGCIPKQIDILPNNYKIFVNLMVQNHILPKKHLCAIL
jgi:hypothetical protein